jgi:hypothetical protein
MERKPRIVSPSGADLDALIARCDRLKKTAFERHAAARALQVRPTLKAVELMRAVRS